MAYVGKMNCAIAVGMVMFVFGLLPAAMAQPAAVSTLDDQTRVEVTVYTNNLGLVKDVRELRLPEGRGELRFMDVAAQIMPETVRVEPFDAQGGFTVLEQNYEYDLMNESKLLDKYVGRDVTLVTWNQYQDRRETVTATLLSNNEGQIYRIGDQIYLGHPGIKVLPELPDDLIAKPTLTWLYDNAQSRPGTLQVSYLTGGISWQADYVLSVNADDTGAGLSGWVTLTNQSGATYRNATLKLVAGDVNRIQQAQPYPAMDMVMAMRTAEAQQFQEQTFFEYHLYDLQRPTTIKQNQTKQVSLLAADGVAVAKEFLVSGQPAYWFRQYSGRELKQPVQIYVTFRNSEENHLGFALPAGIVRLYKSDASGSQQFIGEDRIEHTPKDEEVRLQVGEAFDVVAERRQTDYRQVSTQLYESEWEIVLRNHKAEAVTVGIAEPLQGNWRVLKNSHPYEKEDAFTLRFNVPVPKDGEVRVTYRVQVGLE